MNESFPTPAHVLRTEKMSDGFTKIFIEESGRPFHYFNQPDHGFPHSHPFGMTSHVVIGGYLEEVFAIHENGWSSKKYKRRPGTSHRIEPGTIHRVLNLFGDHCLTHVEPGPPEGDWHFYDFRADGIWRQVPGGEWLQIQ